ncbi:MAG TPA: HAD family hydrolase [Candidatus Acidoferrales bacterium]|jgi:HAD superfamily hydrolase (TIGR01509 family)|nr:HAD family hydrolase [Candidatus Acidoferrales bacterium]
MAETHRKSQHKGEVAPIPQNGPSILFDLDGTLADSVYEHVLGWEEAFQKQRLTVEAWRIHRYIGISGKLLVRGIFREMGRQVRDSQRAKLEELHKKAYEKMLHGVRLLPGARELLSELTRRQIRWAIASSGDEKPVNFLKKKLGVPEGVPAITGQHVEKAKPEPDVFLTAAEQLRVKLQDCIVIGDSIWDLLAARRAGALAVGLLSGGYGRAELERAGAYRVYANPAELLAHLEEIGISSQ